MSVQDSIRSYINSRKGLVNARDVVNNTVGDYDEVALAIEGYTDRYTGTYDLFVGGKRFKNAKQASRFFNGNVSIPKQIQEKLGQIF